MAIMLIPDDDVDSVFQTPSSPNSGKLYFRVVEEKH